MLFYCINSALEHINLQIMRFTKVYINILSGCCKLTTSYANFVSIILHTTIFFHLVKVCFQSLVLQCSLRRHFLSFELLKACY